VVSRARRRKWRRRYATILGSGGWAGGRGRWRCAEGAAAKMAEALRDNRGKRRADGRGREAGAVYTPLLIVSRDTDVPSPISLSLKLPLLCGHPFPLSQIQITK
jgi:hypothetical protein